MYTATALVFYFYSHNNTRYGRAGTNQHTITNVVTHNKHTHERKAHTGQPWRSTAAHAVPPPPTTKRKQDAEGDNNVHPAVHALPATTARRLAHATYKNVNCMGKVLRLLQPRSPVAAATSNTKHAAHTIHALARVPFIQLMLSTNIPCSYNSCPRQVYHSYTTCSCQVYPTHTQLMLSQIIPFTQPMLMQLMQLMISSNVPTTAVYATRQAELVVADDRL